MALQCVVKSVLGEENFGDYEQSVYEKYQEMAEREIISRLNELLCCTILLVMLKQWGAKCACRFVGYRSITVRLKSGKPWQINSPVFIRARPKQKRGRKPGRQKDVVRHPGLELLGIHDRVSPGLVEICVSMAVLCPSFEVASNALRGMGVSLNDHLLQNIVLRFGGLIKQIRVECNSEDVWQEPGLRVLICVDGGRCRERRIKRGRKKEGLKRQGYKSDWFTPWLLSISLFNSNGQKIKSINPIIDGSCGRLEEFFNLLKEYLMSVNLAEASEIVFCADGGNGIWQGIDKLIADLGLQNAKRILDYTHAKQNMNEVKQIIINALKLADTDIKKVSNTIKELLWQGNIDGIIGFVRDKLQRKRKARRAALNKLSNYFGDASKFQYKAFRDNGLPTGSGAVESAIRRIINLRVKGTGLFWKRQNAENMIMLRAIVLTGKMRNVCRKGLGVLINVLVNVANNEITIFNEVP